MSRRAIEIREVRPGDAEALAAELRPQDAAEVEAMHGPGTVEAAIREGIAASTLCWAVDSPAGLVAIAGVAPVSLMGDVGVPWMLCTTRVNRVAGSLMRVAPAYIARMLAAYPRLTNYVDSRNARVCRWLQRLGFTLAPAAPRGPAGVDFHHFEMDLRHV